MNFTIIGKLACLICGAISCLLGLYDGAQAWFAAGFIIIALERKP